MAASTDIAATMTAISVDVFELHLKTKNFHWQMSGSRFRGCHLPLDEQVAQISQ